MMLNLRGFIIFTYNLYKIVQNYGACSLIAKIKPAKLCSLKHFPTLLHKKGPQVFFDRFQKCKKCYLLSQETAEGQTEKKEVCTFFSDIKIGFEIDLQL